MWESFKFKEAKFKCLGLGINRIVPDNSAFLRTRQLRKTGIMRKLVDRSQFIAVFLSCFCSVGLKADTIPLIGPPAEARTVFPFSVGQVVHPVVAKLPTPDFVDEIVSIPMAISSGSHWHPDTFYRGLLISRRHGILRLIDISVRR